jgi:hypothetical protein
LIFTFAKNLFEKARKRMSDMMNDIQSELLTKTRPRLT